MLGHAKPRSAATPISLALNQPIHSKGDTPLALPPSLTISRLQGGNPISRAVEVQ